MLFFLGTVFIYSYTCSIIGGVLFASILLLSVYLNQRLMTFAVAGGSANGQDSK